MATTKNAAFEAVVAKVETRYGKKDGAKIVKALPTDVSWTKAGERKVRRTIRNIAKSVGVFKSPFKAEARKAATTARKASSAKKAAPKAKKS